MANALLEAALAYASRGWPIIPCRSDKSPYVSNGVLDATTDEKQLREWWGRWPRANPALDVAGAGMMVFDLDPGSDFAALEKSLGGIPATRLRATTPRGGTHLFYALAPQDIVAPSASKLAPHVDVRSFHSYVLLAPSATADGTYAWESEGTPAYRTDEMVRRCNTGRAKSSDRDTWTIEPDLPENVALAVEWLKKDARIAIEGMNGDNMAYATAAHLKSFGISEAMAFDLMWEHWSPRCLPPWTEDTIDHLERKVRNGYAYNTSPPGNITPAFHAAKAAELFKPIPVELPSGHEVKAGRFRFVDRDGMEHIAAPEWLIEDFLYQGGSALLIGARGTFKTFLALDIALSIAVGLDPGATAMWGAPWETRVNGPVLFAAGEGRSQIKNRVAAWERTHWDGRKAQGIILSDPVPHIGEDLTPFIAGALGLSPNGYKLVVVDTVGRAMQGVNENAQEHASNYTRMAERLQRELGCAVLGLHHTGHEAGGRARGSSVFEADTDTIVMVTRSGKEYLVDLSMTKQKDAPEWERPRTAKLIEVALGLKLKSLTVVKPEAAERTRKADHAVGDQTVLTVLDGVVAEILRNNKTKAWSTRELAQAVAMHEHVDIHSKTLQNVQLVVLRERKGTVANRCYSPEHNKKWRWQD